MKIKNICRLVLILFLMNFAKEGVCGGIALSATRLIYSADKKSTVLNIINNDDKKRFLIQSWIETSDGKKSDKFIITPPLFVSKPSSENAVRISYVGEGESGNKETVYYLNSKAIPSLDKQSVEGKNVLQIAVLSRIKVFYRPANLKGSSLDAYKQLIFKVAQGGIEIRNPTPYHVTIVNVKINGEKVPTSMIPPYESKVIAYGKNMVINNISFQSVNDFGGNSPVVTVKL